jgi:SsrA-binding protein
MAKKNKLGLSKEVQIKNRQAYYNYTIEETWHAGIMLKGTEVKSVRMSKVTLGDAFCVFIGEELFIRNMHIAPYAMGTDNNHEAKRDRKLLLKRRELLKIQEELKNQGLTIVPTRLFVNERGLVKVQIGLAKGKKLFDKRQSIKEKDVKRDLDRY